MLFVKGKRPNRVAIGDFVRCQRSVSLSYDPKVGSPLHLVYADGETLLSKPDKPPEISDESVWLELLHNGLAFDLVGLAPGDACETPAIEHRFDFDAKGFAGEYEALQIVAGEHLESGKASMPVVKGMVALARDFVHHFDAVEGIMWPPASSAIGRRFFESISTAWLEGGAFPALGLTAFREAMDGAIQSVGLDFWIGQEIRIENPLAQDKVSATRLGVRIVNHLVLSGGLKKTEKLIGPDRTPLIMRPTRNQKFIRVCPQ